MMFIIAFLLLHQNTSALLCSTVPCSKNSDFLYYVRPEENPLGARALKVFLNLQVTISLKIQRV